jgi:hypothetical protein
MKKLKFVFKMDTKETNCLSVDADLKGRTFKVALQQCHSGDYAQPPGTIH